MSDPSEPVGFRTPDPAAPVISVSAELTAEGGEHLPFQPGTMLSGVWPPTGFSVGSSSSTSNTVPLFSKAPQLLNLEFVEGDTLQVPVMFTDVCWLPEDPGEFVDNTPRTITHYAVVDNVVTLTSADHGFIIGQSVKVSGLGGTYDGIYLVTDASSDTFSYALETPDAEADDTGQAEIANVPNWEECLWAAQVRHPYALAALQNDAWVPARGLQYRWWRNKAIVAIFHCDAELQYGYVLDQEDDKLLSDGTPNPDYGAWIRLTGDEEVPIPAGHTARWATQVTVTMTTNTSAHIVPGNWYRYDLQSRRRDAVTTIDPGDTPVLSDLVETHLSGRVRVLPEWTVA